MFVQQTIPQRHEDGQHGNCVKPPEEKKGVATSKPARQKIKKPQSSIQVR